MELMAEKRETLTKLLLDLISKKHQRAEDLQRMMQEMETGKDKEQENYWLIQYQKLLDSKPKGLEAAEEKLDSKVIFIRGYKLAQSCALSLKVILNEFSLYYTRCQSKLMKNLSHSSCIKLVGTMLHSHSWMLLKFYNWRPSCVPTTRISSKA